MAKSNASASDYNKLIYNATAIANIADNAAASPLASIFISAHTADPGAAGTQATSEAAYTGYTRATVARTTGGFTDSNGTLTLVADAAFGTPTASGTALTHWSTGVAVSGASKVLHRGVFGFKQGPFTGVVTGNVLTIPGHTLAVNDNCCFYAVNGSSLPGGVTEATVYFVKTVSSNDITISATLGGAAITVSSAGDGMSYKVTPLTPANGVGIRLVAGAIAIEE